MKERTESQFGQSEQIEESMDEKGNEGCSGQGTKEPGQSPNMASVPHVL